jgi:nitrile hydratase beta subunit
VDGIHDMGGMQGFGAVAPEPDEPAFHERWEGRVFGMSLTLWATGGPIGGMRPQLERIETGRYLASSYYERWENALEVMLAERGVLTPADVDRGVEGLRAGAQVPERSDPGMVEAVLADMQPRPPARPEGGHRFAAGQPVRVRRISTAAHNRCPRYVRGVSGVVQRLLPADWLPENEDLGEQRRAPCYTVSFAAADLWPDDGADHTVLVDLWETYLEETV